MNKYICRNCGTVYYTPEDKEPPTPNWDDGHKCTLEKKERTDENKYEK